VQDLELLGTEGNSLDTPRDALSFNECPPLRNSCRS